MRWSSRFLPRGGLRCRPVSLEGGAKSIKPRLPVAAISRHPRIKAVECFLAQRIKALLPVGAHLHNPRLRQDAQVSRNTGLMDVHALDNVAHSGLSFPKIISAHSDGAVRKELAW